MHDNTKFSVGDLLCYYDGVNFQKTPQSNYPFVVDNNKKNVIYVDFTSDKHNAIVEEVYKISGTITVNCDTEEFENNGKELRDVPFVFHIYDDKGGSISLHEVACTINQTEENKTTYTYETYVYPEVTQLQVSYAPFTDWSLQVSDVKYDLNLAGDTELNFTIEDF